MKKKLTVKQANFLKAILEGKTQLEAYKTAFNTKGKDTTLTVKASNLFKSEAIQEEYKKALNNLLNKALYSKERAVEDLVYLVEKAKEDIEEQGIKQSNVLGLTKAIEQLTGVLGFNYIDNKKIELEKEKIEISKSKLQKDNDGLQKENADLLRKLVLNN